jgi:NAD(P)-dependent dehydrogenase (short-subunit alcohol dehydrogenase family)
VLTSFSSPANAVVIGASGGIGSALLDQLSADPAIASLHALSRTAPACLPETAGHHFIDVTDEDSIIRAASGIDAAGPLDLVIIATGVLHNGSDIMPEKAMRDLSPGAMAAVFEANCIGPAIVAKHLLPRMRRGAKSVFAALSARVGSISDNRLGGWVSYRASKAALNMTLRTLSIEHARRFPESIVVGLHPGTVATSLSEPFSSRVEPQKLFTPAQSAAYLLDVIDSLDASDTGNTFAWDGKKVPF